MSNTTQTFGKETSSALHDGALGAEHAIRSTEQAAQKGLDRMSESLEGARVQSAAALHHMAQDTKALAQHGMDAVRDGSHHLQERSAHAKDLTTQYIQHQPVKSMLIAAAVGATLMGIAALLGRHGGSGR